MPFITTRVICIEADGITVARESDQRHDTRHKRCCGSPKTACIRSVTVLQSFVARNLTNQSRSRRGGGMRMTEDSELSVGG